MFTAFLREHPMKEMILKQDLRLYPTAEDRKAWEDIPAAYREEIRRLAAEYGRIPYPARTASGFLAFVRNGDRQADEQPYFNRRRKLCAAALDACAFPDNANMDEIVDGIWLVCEETSWVISAHNVNPIPGAPPAAEYPLPDLRKPYIDLFSAQTGMILSLTAALLETAGCRLADDPGTDPGRNPQTDPPAFHGNGRLLVDGVPAEGPEQLDALDSVKYSYLRCYGSDGQRGTGFSADTGLRNAGSVAGDGTGGRRMRRGRRILEHGRRRTAGLPGDSRKGDRRANAVLGK